MANIVCFLPVCLSQAQLKRKEPSVPKFYFPEGRPEAMPNIDNLISNIKKTFSQFPQKRATIEDMGLVAKVRM